MKHPIVIAQNFGLDVFRNQADKLSRLSQDQEFYLTIIVSIINFLLAIAGAVAVIYAMYSGIIILGAFGDQDKITTAKQNFINIAIGIAIIVTTFTIINLVARFLRTGSL